MKKLNTEQKRERAQKQLFKEENDFWVLILPD